MTKLNELSKNKGENEVENELIRRGLHFQKENEYVYSIDNTKLVVCIENKALFYRKLGGLNSFDEVIGSSPQKRSNSAIRFDSSKVGVKKTFKFSNPSGQRSTSKHF